MMMQETYRDERTVTVENNSYRWGYLFLSYGLLLITAYRGFVLNQSSWDLIALVVVGGGVTTLYQAKQRVLSGRWAMLTLAAAVIAAIIAVLLVVLT